LNAISFFFSFPPTTTRLFAFKLRIADADRR
jgi:hypothetical protein